MYPRECILVYPCGYLPLQHNIWTRNKQLHGILGNLARWSSPPRCDCGLT